MNYRNAFIFMILVQVLYFFPVLFKGEVIFPHNNDYEVGATRSVTGDGHISNRKFSDNSSVFIPEINRHLNGNNRGWLSTWNPSVQLGRPTTRLFGRSKADILIHALSLFTKNPFVLYTWMTLITVFLTGVFFFLLLKSLDLHPVACASAAMGISMGVFVSYWLTFVIFLSVVCWTTCLLWLITRFIKAQSYGLALGIAFATYSMLMTGYPQPVVRAVYFICVYTLVLMWWSEKTIKTNVAVALKLLVSAAIGAAMASPVYLDLLVRARMSARLDVGDEFFQAVLPGIKGLGDLGIFLNTLFDAFWLGNPIEPGYPIVFNGLSFTPLYSGLFLLTLVNGLWRRLWPLHLFVFFCLIATLWPTAYLFAVHYLGFHFSRSLMLSGSIIPVFILGGYAADHILRDPAKQGLVRAAIVFLPLALAGYVMFMFWGEPLERSGLFYAVSGGLIVAGVYLFAVTKKGLVLWALTVITVFAYGYNLKLTRPMENIQVSSDIVELIKAETEGGLRFGFVGRKNIIPPNQEGLLGIRSIHSYDSLSSKNYQRLVRRLSEKGAVTYGRHFLTITDDKRLGDDAFSYTGIGLFISRHAFAAPNVEMIGRVAGYFFYRRTPRPVLEAQVADFTLNEGKHALIMGSMDEAAGLPVERLEDLDDFTLFKVTPADRETLLFVSRQYHPHWRAGSRAGLLDTVMINDFYQGVIVPPDTEMITLEFRPYSIWTWIPQAVFVLLALVLLANRVFLKGDRL